MLEGEQAEAYKARKAKEVEANEAKSYDSMKDIERRISQTSNPKQIKNIQNAMAVGMRDTSKRVNNGEDFALANASSYSRSYDAIARHMRRHPDQWDGSKRIKTRSEACSIFESVEFLND